MAYAEQETLQAIINDVAEKFSDRPINDLVLAEIYAYMFQTHGLVVTQLRHDGTNVTLVVD